MKIFVFWHVIWFHLINFISRENCIVHSHMIFHFTWFNSQGQRLTFTFGRYLFYFIWLITSEQRRIFFSFKYFFDTMNYIDKNKHRYCFFSIEPSVLLESIHKSTYRYLFYVWYFVVADWVHNDREQRVFRSHIFLYFNSMRS